MTWWEYAAAVTGPRRGVGRGERRAELAEALAAVRERVAAAARAAGRDPAEVGLLAVTKTWPAADVALLLDLGLTAFGENKEQEGAAKAAELAALRPDVAARWHVVGRLQRNKARSVARWAHAVDSVDSARLVDALDARRRGRVRRGGADRRRSRSSCRSASTPTPTAAASPVDEVPGLADRVAACAHLRLGGVMAVAPQDVEPRGGLRHGVARSRRGYARRTRARRRCRPGMSGDLEAAVEYGSTVRACRNGVARAAVS